MNNNQWYMNPYCTPLSAVCVVFKFHGRDTSHLSECRANFAADSFNRERNNMNSNSIEINDSSAREWHANADHPNKEDYPHIWCLLMFWLYFCVYFTSRQHTEPSTWCNHTKVCLTFRIATCKSCKRVAFANQQVANTLAYFQSPRLDYPKLTRFIAWSQTKSDRQCLCQGFHNYRKKAKSISLH